MMMSLLKDLIPIALTWKSVTFHLKHRFLLEGFDPEDRTWCLGEKEGLVIMKAISGGILPWVVQKRFRMLACLNAVSFWTQSLPQFAACSLD
jgi:hypothetical protein